MMMWIVLLISHLSWAAPQKIELMGYSDQNPLWKLELTINKRCEFTGRYFSSAKTSKTMMDGEDCERIKSELANVVSETQNVPDNNRPKVVTYYTDEPSFVFVLGAKTFQAKFDSPETCKFKDQTTEAMDCVSNNLTAAQRLLILMRPAARELKFIR